MDLKIYSEMRVGSSCDIVRDGRMRSEFQVSAKKLAANGIALTPEEALRNNLHTSPISDPFEYAYFGLDCENCQACIPARIDLARFDLGTRGRDIMAANSDLTVAYHDGIKPVSDLSDPHFIEYSKLSGRHISARDLPPSWLINYDYNPLYQYAHFTARDATGTLVAVACYESAGRATLGITHFYDPDRMDRMTGRFVILQSLDYFKKHDLFDHAYLSNWNPLSRPTGWKIHVRGLQLMLDDEWKNANRSDTWKLAQDVAERYGQVDQPRAHPYPFFPLRPF